MGVTAVQCQGWDEAEIHLASVHVRLTTLEGRTRHIEKQLDTLGSPWWKRVWFRLDGWPTWYIVGPRAWRPWHR